MAVHCAAHYAAMHSMQHTLGHCPAWALPRHYLIGEIGWDLSPPAILAVLLVSERGRGAVISFCERVMFR
jgi:hypothetical protein